MAENRFGAISAEEEDEAPAAPRFGAISAEEEEEPAAPASAAQASISEAFNKPAAGQRGMLSKAAEAGLFGLADIGSGAVAGAPLGLGPSVLGMLPGTSTEEVKKDIAAAKARSPVLFGVGEFGSELATTFLPGAAAGEFLATKAAPALTRAFPVLSKAPGVLEAALKGIGLGTVTGGEEAGRAVVEGAPVGEALKAGAETGGSMMLMPLGFQAAPAVAKVAPQVVRAGIEKVPSYLRNLVPEVISSPAAATGRAVEATSRFLAPAVAPVGLAYESMPSKDASASEWTKWALNQGVLAGGVAGEGFEKLAAKSRESIQPKLRRATAEGMELARGDIYKDVRADETVRNQQFRAALTGEQRAMTAAEKIKQGDLTEIDKLANDTLDLDALVKGLGDGTDPSLRGLLGKLFQDVSNRLLRAKQALANRPELADKTLVEKINTVDRLIEESYLKNTEKGGYLEDFNDDPYARLEVERQSRLKKATEQRDAVAARQAELLSRVASRNYLEEARAQRRPPTVPEDVARQLAEKAGLEYAGPDEQFGKPVRHSVKLSPEKQTELEAQTQAEFDRQVKAGGRSLQGLAPEAEYGEKPPFFDPMNPTRLRAATQPVLPDWVQPSVALRAIAGPVRALAKAPQSEFQETQRIESAKRPTEDVMARPYNTVAMLRAWDKVLERPSEKTVGALARVADRMGITYDKLLKTTAYRAAALEQALKDPEVAKEVMANVEQR